MQSPDWHVSMFNIHHRKRLWMYCPEQAIVKENDRADRLARLSSHQQWLESRKFELLRSLARDTTFGHKTKNITPLVAWRREELKEEAHEDLS